MWFKIKYLILFCTQMYEALKNDSEENMARLHSIINLLCLKCFILRTARHFTERS